MANKIDYGIIITVVAALLFYLRLIIIQWGRAKRLRDSVPTAPAKTSVKGKKQQKTQQKEKNTRTMEKYGFKVRSWTLVIVAIVLIVAGALMNGLLADTSLIRSFWWFPTTMGILIFTFSFK